MSNEAHTHVPDVDIAADGGTLVLSWSEVTTERDLITLEVTTRSRARRLRLDEAQVERLRALLPPPHPHKGGKPKG